MIDESRTGNSILVLLTDGENHVGDPLQAAEEAAQRGLTIHVIGYGDPEGVLIPVYDDAGQLIGHKEDQAGNLVVSRLNEPLLTQIADDTGGLYQQASDSGVEIINLLNTISGMEQTLLQKHRQTRPIERFSLFVALAVLALTIEIFLPEILADAL